MECKVFATREDKACAYCKRHGKQGCAAGTEPEQEEDTEFTGLEERVADLEETVHELATRCELLQNKINRMDTLLGQVKNTVIWAKFEVKQTILDVW